MEVVHSSKSLEKTQVNYMVQTPKRRPSFEEKLLWTVEIYMKNYYECYSVVMFGATCMQ